VLDGDIHNYIAFSPTRNGMDLYDSNLVLEIILVCTFLNVTDLGFFHIC
jgi:hypothetical protein